MPRQAVGLGLHRRLLPRQAIALRAPQTIIRHPPPPPPRCNKFGHAAMCLSCLWELGSVVLTKISLPTSRLQVSDTGTLVRSIASSSILLTGLRGGLSFYFQIFFRPFFYDGDQTICWWRICRWRAVNIRDPPIVPA